MSRRWQVVAADPAALHTSPEAQDMMSDYVCKSLKELDRFVMQRLRPEDRDGYHMRLAAVMERMVVAGFDELDEEEMYRQLS